MRSVEYSLFRAKFIRPQQTDIEHTDITPQELFLRSIAEKPSCEIRSGHMWHIGNIEHFSEEKGYFAAGRTTRTTLERYDEDTKDFQEEELETSPYTHCVFDAGIGFLGIAAKPRLAPTPKGIAAKIQSLLSQTEVVVQNEISVELSPIPDPEGFLSALSSAYRIARFKATFRGPNPFDADEHFQRPLSVYLAAANGTLGNAQISGEALDSNVLQKVSRSTAATGNSASARIEREQGERLTTISMKEEVAKRRYDDGDLDQAEVLRDLTALYRRVRGNG